MKHDSCSGLGMLELLTVLCLLSAFGLFASRCFEEVISRQLVRRTGRALAGFLEHKGLEAMTRRRPIYLLLAEEGGEIFESAEPPGAGTRSDLVYRLPAGLSFRGSHLPRLRNFPPHLRFGEDGGSTAASIRVSGPAGTEECMIVQAISGRRTLRCMGEM